MSVLQLKSIFTGRIILSFFILLGFTLFFPNDLEAAGYGWNKDKFTLVGCHQVTVRVMDSSGVPIVPDKADIEYIKDGSSIWNYSGGGVSSISSPCLDPTAGNPTFQTKATVIKDGYNDFYSNNWMVQWVGSPSAIYKWTKDIYMTKEGAPPNNDQISPKSSFSTDPLYLNYNPSFVWKGEVLPGSGFTSINAATLNVFKKNAVWDLIIKERIAGVWDSANHTFTIPPQTLPGDGQYRWGSYLESWTDPTDLLSHNSNDVTSAFSFEDATFGLDRLPPAASCSASVGSAGNDITVTLNPTDATSGVYSGQVEYTTANDPTDPSAVWITNGLPGTPEGNTVASFPFTGAFGNKYTFRFRARDNAIDSDGNKEQWSEWNSCGTVTAAAASGSTVNVKARKLDNTGACTDTGAVVEGFKINLDPDPGGNKTTDATGSISISGLPDGVYELSATSFAEKNITGPVISSSPLGFKFELDHLDPSKSSRNALFCIDDSLPWIRTDFGDVRFKDLRNPVPTGQKGSKDPNFPGIFFSSKSEVGFTFGLISDKLWKVEREYSYNQGASDRNGTFSYSFFESKAKQDGITPDLLDLTSSLESQLNSGPQDGRVFKVNSTLPINDHLTISGGRRRVILVDGDVEIHEKINVNDDSLLVIAAKGDIIIDESVGDLASDNSNHLEGYYTSEGSIILEGNRCQGGIADNRLNVEGALIANSKKPFASSGVGGIVKWDNRSLCPGLAGNGTYPVLDVRTRPAFLPLLTDFYKISYTKWEEARP